MVVQVIKGIAKEKGGDENDMFTENPALFHLKYSFDCLKYLLGKFAAFCQAALYYPNTHPPSPAAFNGLLGKCPLGAQNWRAAQLGAKHFEELKLEVKSRNLETGNSRLDVVGS